MPLNKITQEEFIQKDANYLGITIDEWKKKYIAIPCDAECDYEGCQGWQLRINYKE